MKISGQEVRLKHDLSSAAREAFAAPAAFVLTAKRLPTRLISLIGRLS
jgi:hypothetical protein